MWTASAAANVEETDSGALDGETWERLRAIGHKGIGGVFEVNREILFRGKRTDNGDKDRFGVCGYKVEPSTVGQYTGLKAHNWRWRG